VAGRYRTPGTTDITLSGTVNGAIQTFTFPNQTFPESSVSNLQSSIPRLWATRKIGYLLNQVRLHGPEQELIDQIVRLSIRYGIVTPYTSYLVMEPMPLGVEAQQQIAEEAFKNLESAPAAPAYGQDAVEQAAAESQMRQSDTVQAPAAEAAGRVRIVGAHTFVLSDGVWVDTAFDPETMQTVRVAFLSEDYFALVERYPELGASFALGPRVIAVLDGAAYEVTGSEVPLPPLGMPEPTSPPPPAGTEAVSTPEDSSGAVNPPEARPVSPASGRGFPCLAGMLPLGLVFVGVRKCCKKTAV